MLENNNCRWVCIVAVDRKISSIESGERMLSNSATEHPSRSMVNILLTLKSLCIASLLSKCLAISCPEPVTLGILIVADSNPRIASNSNGSQPIHRQKKHPPTPLLIVADRQFSLTPYKSLKTRMFSFCPSLITILIPVTWVLTSRPCVGTSANGKRFFIKPTFFEALLVR